MLIERSLAPLSSNDVVIDGRDGVYYAAGLVISGLAFLDSRRRLLSQQSSHHEGLRR